MAKEASGRKIVSSGPGGHHPITRLRRGSGYLLMEAVVTCLILSLSIVALMPIFSMAVKGNRRSEKILVASHLAHELMEEIKLRKWDEASLTKRPGPIPAPSPLGPDAGEDKTDKRTFNDIDDFDGWIEDPPSDPVMRPFSQFKDYQRGVSVGYVDGELSDSKAPANYKRVRVCVQTKNVTWTCLDRIFANY